MIQHTLTGAGVPQIAPPSLSAHYLDLTNGDEYYAAGVTSPADWERRPRVSDLDQKVSVQEGKDLSSNDYTDEDKARVQSLTTSTVMLIASHDGVTTTLPADTYPAGSSDTDSAQMTLTIPLGVTALVEVSFDFSLYLTNSSAENAVTIFPQVLLDSAVISPSLEAGKLLNYGQERVGRQSRLRFAVIGDGQSRTLKFRVRNSWTAFTNPGSVSYRVGSVLMTVSHSIG